MFSFDEENSYLPIKTTAEYFYCERAAFYMLMHWENDIESKYFYKGYQQHRAIEKIPYKHRSDSKIFYRYFVVSHKLKIYGICDAVEMSKDKSIIIPIEYKTGKIRFNFMHKVQLCLQALCLEEMTKKIRYGYLYFIESHKRRKLIFNENEKKVILAKIAQFRKKLQNPELKNFKPCNNRFCSYHTIDDPILYR